MATSASSVTPGIDRTLKRVGRSGDCDSDGNERPGADDPDLLARVHDAHSKEPHPTSGSFGVGEGAESTSLYAPRVVGVTCGEQRLPLTRPSRPTSRRLVSCRAPFVDLCGRAERVRSASAAVPLRCSRAAPPSLEAAGSRRPTPAVRASSFGPPSRSVASESRRRLANAGALQPKAGEHSADT